MFGMSDGVIESSAPRGAEADGGHREADGGQGAGGQMNMEGRRGGE